MNNANSFIKSQLDQRKNTNRKRLILWLSICILLLTSVILYHFYKPSIYRSLGLVADKAEQTASAKELSREAKLLEMERESKAAFGTEVVWVQFPRESYEEVSDIAIDQIPIGFPLSFIGTPSGDMMICVSKRCAKKLSSVIEDLIILEK